MWKIRKKFRFLWGLKIDLHEISRFEARLVWTGFGAMDLIQKLQRNQPYIYIDEFWCKRIRVRRSSDSLSLLYSNHYLSHSTGGGAGAVSEFKKYDDIVLFVLLTATWAKSRFWIKCALYFLKWEMSMLFD